MGDWWMTGFCVMSVAALVMLGLGLWLGYRWGLADREAAEAEFTFYDRILDPQVKAPLPWEEIVPAVRRAREDAPPGRATDFIEKLTADTDRWIAEHETGE